MSSDGIAGIQARIAQIQTRFGAASSTGVSAQTTAARSGASTQFSDVLASAVARHSGGAGPKPLVAALGSEAAVSGSAATSPAVAALGGLGTAAAAAGGAATSPALTALGAGTGTATSPALAALGAGTGTAGVGAGTSGMIGEVLRTAAAAAAGRGTSLLPTSGHTSGSSGLASRPSVNPAGGADGALTPAVKRSPGSYSKLQAPPELVGYGNGRIPAGRLEPIGRGGHRLYAPASRAFRHMTADAAAAGVRIGVTDSYRSYSEQVDVARRKGLYSQGGLAAQPGTSNHGWGLALDLDLNSKAQSWMRANGHRYGFVEDTPREPWHWAYRPAS